MWGPSDDILPRSLMLDARGRWVSSLEDPLPDLWIDAAPFFAALSLPTPVASDDGNEKLAAENLSTTGVSPWTILKSPGGDRAPPLEYAQHILDDDDAVAQVAEKMRAWNGHAASLLAKAKVASVEAASAVGSLTQAGAANKNAAHLAEQTRGLREGIERHTQALNEALFVAAAQGNEKCVKVLLAAGADSRPRNDGSLSGPSILRLEASRLTSSVGSFTSGPSKDVEGARAAQEVRVPLLLQARMSVLEMECSYLTRRRRRGRSNSSGSANSRTTGGGQTSSGSNTSESKNSSSSSSDESLRLVAIVPDAPGQPSDFGWCVDLARRCRYDFTVAPPADSSPLEEATSDASNPKSTPGANVEGPTSINAPASAKTVHAAPVVCTLPWNGMPAGFHYLSPHKSSERSDDNRGSSSGSSNSSGDSGGDSGISPEVATLQAWADYVETKLLAGAPGPALAKSAVLVGVGQGANAALQVATRKPLLGLVLVDPGIGSGIEATGAPKATNSSTCSVQDIDAWLASVDWLAVVKNVKHLFVLWTPTSIAASADATTTAVDDIVPASPALAADHQSGRNKNSTSMGTTPEAVARVWKCVQAALRGEQIEEDAPVAERRLNAIPVIDEDLAPAAGTQSASSCHAFFASAFDLTLSGANKGENKGAAATAVANSIAVAPIAPLVRADHDCSPSLSSSTEDNRLDGSNWKRSTSLGAKLRPCAPPGVLAAVRFVLRAHGGLTTYTPASTRSFSSSEGDDVLRAAGAAATAAATMEDTEASAQSSPPEANQAVATKVEQKGGARAAAMSKVLQKASKKAEAKRAQSGAHNAATSEVERCLSGELVIDGLQSEAGAKMNGKRGYCKGPLLKTGRLAFYASEGQGVNEGPYMIKPSHLRLLPQIAEDDADAPSTSSTLEQSPENSNPAPCSNSGAQSTENMSPLTPITVAAAKPPPPPQPMTRESERQSLEAAISAAQSPEDLAVAMAHVKAFQNGGRRAPPSAPSSSSSSLPPSSSSSSISSCSITSSSFSPPEANRTLQAPEMVVTSITSSTNNSEAFDLDSDFSTAAATTPVTVADSQWHSMDDFGGIPNSVSGSPGDCRSETNVAIPVIPEANAEFSQHDVAVAGAEATANGDGEAPVAVAWVAGQRVIVRGLVGRPELNGMRGCVEKYFPNTERFAVSLDGEKGRFQLKASNLFSEARIAEEEDSTAHQELTTNDEAVEPAVIEIRSDEHIEVHEDKDEKWFSGASGVAHVESQLEEQMQYAASSGGGTVEPLPASAMNLSLDDLCGGDLATNTSLNLNLMSGGLNLDGGDYDDNGHVISVTEERAESTAGGELIGGSSEGSKNTSSIDGSYGGSADDASWMSGAFDEAAVAKTEALARQLEEGSLHSQPPLETAGTTITVPVGAGEHGWQDLSSILAAQRGSVTAATAAASSLPPHPKTAAQENPDRARESTPVAAAATPVMAAAAAATTTAGPAPDSSERVMLCGLTRKPELNGCCGTVVSYSLSEDRFAIQLDDGRGPYKLKASNLQAAPRGYVVDEGIGQDTTGMVEAVADGSADDTSATAVDSIEEGKSAAAIGGSAVVKDASNEEASGGAQPYAGSAQMELLRKFYAEGNSENRRAVEKALRHRTSGK